MKSLKKTTTIAGVKVDAANFNNLAGAIRAFNHPLRQDILLFIEKCKGQRTNVTNVYTKLNLEQAVASQHLAILRDAGLVISIKEGKERFYQVSALALDRLNKAAAQFSSVAE